MALSALPSTSRDVSRRRPKPGGLLAGKGRKGQSSKSPPPHATPPSLTRAMRGMDATMREIFQRGDASHLPSSSARRTAGERESVATSARAGSGLRMTWFRLPPTSDEIPSARQGHTANTVGRDTMVIFGGLDGSGGKRSNATHIFNLPDRKWSQVSPTGSLPRPRAYCTSWICGRRLFIHGGEGSPPFPMANSKSVIYDDLYCLDLDSGHWECIETEIAPLARRGHASAVANRLGEELVFLFGGMTGDPGSPSSHSTAIHTIPKNQLLEQVEKGMSGTEPPCQWRRPRVEGLSPCARHGHTFTSLGDRILLVGGVSHDGRLLQDVWSLELSESTLYWSQLVQDGLRTDIDGPLVLPPIHGHSACCLDSDRLLIFGGSMEGSYGSHLMVYSVKEGTWSRVAVGFACPHSRYNGTMAVAEGWDPPDFSLDGKVVDGEVAGRLVVKPFTQKGTRRTAIVFGGLNSVFVPSDVWILPLELSDESSSNSTRGGTVHSECRRAALAPLSPLHEGCGRLASEGILAMEAELMNLRRAYYLAENRLGHERSRRREAENSALTIKSQSNSLLAKFREAELQHLNTIQELEVKLKQLEATNAQLREDNDEAYKLLALSELRHQFESYGSRAEQVDEQYSVEDRSVPAESQMRETVLSHHRRESLPFV